MGSLSLDNNNDDARHQVQSPIPMEETCNFNALNADIAQTITGA